MGTDYKAWIEYDIGAYNARKQGLPLSTVSAPFTGLQWIRSIAPAGMYTDWGCKDYGFISAVSGYRNDTGIPPLYPLRGLPQNIHWQTKFMNLIDGEWESGFTWLTLREIHAALAHQGQPYKYLAYATRVSLEIMEVLERRFGVDRVRLIFTTD